MHLKLLEDYIALAASKNFSAAARLRNVTHPAFGRRIKALEQWVGAELVTRAGDSQGFGLTPSGEEFLVTAYRIVENLSHARQNATRTSTGMVRICTGRTLARTMVADWVAQLQPLMAVNKALGFQIRTTSLHEGALLLEADQCHFMVAYQHRTIDLHLDTRRYEYMQLGSDKLVAVATHQPKTSDPSNPHYLLQFAKGLALRTILDDGLLAAYSSELSTTEAPGFRIIAECDSPDAIHALALKGLGIAWLPWTLVAKDCQQKRLVVLKGPAWPEFPFEVRVYRKKRKLSAIAEQIWVSAS
jgi:LysR family transcriptional regulator, hypochlorite-specific transcription factor HypT